MALPTYAVRISTGPQPDALTLDDAILGKLDTGGVLGDGLSLEWDDITTYIRESSGIVVNRGGTNKRGPYFAAEAGTATFTLSNLDGRFDPFFEGSTTVGSTYGSSTYGSSTYGSSSAESPYWINGESILRPGLPVSIIATHDGRTYDLFTGKVQSWKVTYPENAIDSVVVVTAVDAVSDLNEALVAESGVEVGVGDTPGERIERVLDAIDWPDARRLVDDTDTTEILSTFYGRPVWQEIADVSDAVNGYLWVGPDGTVRFQSKSQFPRAADFEVGVAAGAVPTADVQVNGDIDQLYNVVALAREDGATQTVTDTDSIDKFGRRSFDRSGLPLATDDSVLSSLVYILSQHKDLRRRVEGFSIPMHAGRDDAAWRNMLGLDVLRRVSASFSTPHGTTVTGDGLVRGLRLTIRATVWTWEVSTLGAPEALGDFTLDDPTLGVLGLGTLAAF